MPRADTDCLTEYIVKRLALSVIILLGVSLIIYTLIRIQPGLDFVEKKYQAQLQQDSTGQVAELVKQTQSTYGLDTNIFSGYLKWLSNILQGDFGNSFQLSVPTGEVTWIDMVGPDGSIISTPKYETTSNVVSIIFAKSGVSFLIALIATVLEFIIAIPLGIVSATKQYGAVDYTVTVLAMMGISLPSFFLGALLLKVFSVELGWFPYSGLSDPNSSLPLFIDQAWHLVLPIVVLTLLSVGGLMRYTRTNMLEVMNSDYIRTARAKGLSEHSVIYKHAFRNTLIPLATLFAGILPSLFGGAMITEQVFSIDGIGKAAYTAVVNGDVPFVMAYCMFLSILTVIGTLLSDIMYAVVDPRVKLS